ncbi:hypothetical protein niasHT_036089 [Heterodera trifolii]|uniref:Uncharacterized protein n=1 Tax=Heterodera trifolii TaxID=157864 RepID=A0ABD2I529_9BILA
MIFSGKYQWNDWGGYMASFTEQICSNEYAKIAKQNYLIDIKQELPNDIGPWKCTCHFGGVGENMTNAHLVPPTKTMKCKSALGSESEMIREEERECFNDKCGAVFCSAKNGTIQWNEWDCFNVSLKERICAKDKARVVGQERIRHNFPSADGWNCTCLFGEMWSDMTNAHFVPQAVTPADCECASIRHGVGMASLVVGLIISFFVTIPFQHIGSA